MQSNSEYFLQQREIEHKVYDTRKKYNSLTQLLIERNFLTNKTNNNVEKSKQAKD
jgi:hypothetical protein